MLFDHNDRVVKIPPPAFVSWWRLRLRTLLKFSIKVNQGVNTLYFTLHLFQAAALKALS